MKLSRSYKLRLLRKKWQLRTWRKRKDLSFVKLGDAAFEPSGIFVFTTLRNEHHRLPYFLEYYRNLGITQFFIVDNDSNDGSAEYLLAQPDVSVWHTKASYKSAKYGVLWMNQLLYKYGSKHWCLNVDCDEFFVYPHVSKRPIRALTDWLDTRSLRSFPAMLLDMYAKENLEDIEYDAGQNPFEVLNYFDSGNYTQQNGGRYGNLWIQGGPRQRKFFANQPRKAPALNKIPLVKWKSSYVYTSSTHSLLPRSLNLTFDDRGGEKISGCLLHSKFLPDADSKISEELHRQEHYEEGQEYKAYGSQTSRNLNFWTANSTRFQNWQQLEDLGLMSSGGWA